MKKVLSILCSLALLSTGSVISAYATEDIPAETDTSVVNKTNTVSETDATSETLFGDLDGDGTITPKDAIVALQKEAHYILTVSDDPEKAKELYCDANGDVYEDGLLDGKDTIIILLYVGYTYAYPDSTLSLKEYYKKYGFYPIEKKEIEDSMEKVDDECESIFIEKKGLT